MNKNKLKSRPDSIFIKKSAEIIPEIFSKLKPDGIDSSSRLETSPGIKNLKKVASLVRTIRESN